MRLQGTECSHWLRVLGTTLNYIYKYCTNWRWKACMKETNALSSKSPVVDGERMRPGQWLESVFWVSLIMVTATERYLIFILRPLLVDRGHITKQIRSACSLMCKHRLKQKCFSVFYEMSSSFRSVGSLFQTESSVADSLTCLQCDEVACSADCVGILWHCSRDDRKGIWRVKTCATYPQKFSSSGRRKRGEPGRAAAKMKVVDIGISLMTCM